MGLSLDGMHGGAVLERVNYELADVIKNLRDPNTAREAPRKLVIEMIFDPKVAEDRSFVGIHVKVRKQLAPLKPVSTIATFDGAGETLRLVEVESSQVTSKDPRQSAMRDNVVPMKDKEGSSR